MRPRPERSSAIRRKLDLDLSSDAITCFCRHPGATVRHAQCREPPSNTTRAGHGRPALRGLGRTPCAQTPHLAGSHAALASAAPSAPPRARAQHHGPPTARTQPTLAVSRAPHAGPAPRNPVSAPFGRSSETRLWAAIWSAFRSHARRHEAPGSAAGARDTQRAPHSHPRTPAWPSPRAPTPPPSPWRSEQIHDSADSETAPPCPLGRFSADSRCVI